MLRSASIAVVGAVVLGSLGYSAVIVGKSLVPYRTFYVSATGSDQNDGRTPRRALATLKAVNALELRPGDHVRLDPRVMFTGSLVLDHHDAGNADDPVVIETAGPGRATISASGGPAVAVVDTAGVEIRDLTLVGNTTTEDGLRFVNNAKNSTRLRGIEVSGVEASGFRNGITLTATGNSGFEQVTIENSTVHDNVAAGLSTSGPTLTDGPAVYAHKDLLVRNVEAHHNHGDPLATKNTGSGIVLGSVEDATVTRSTAHENGGSSNTTEGPVGIWAYDSEHVVFEHNLSYRNLTQGADGGGFDFDQGVTNSLMQFNLSYENHSYGYLLYTNAPKTDSLKNVIRNNVSINDAASGTQYYGSITLLGGLSGPHTAGGIRDAAVYNNTVVTSPMAGGTPSAVLIGGTLEKVVVANNAFIVNGPNRLVQSIDADPGDVRFAGNSYSAPAGAFAITWGPQTYPDLPSWQAATTQETLGGAPVAVIGGSVVDPKLVEITDAHKIETLVGFRPLANSPLIGGGVNLASAFGIDPDNFRDYLGSPRVRTRWDIGAASGER
ncbi:MAG: right-handed parallel beta-helix repeat-containing protein [Nocardiaceae bacterium]|nr:right-handed parallel beta-helix repeat-containing protein [Nocardiaceae bacterium]